MNFEHKPPPSALGRADTPRGRHLDASARWRHFRTNSPGILELVLASLSTTTAPSPIGSCRRGFEAGSADGPARVPQAGEFVRTGVATRSSSRRGAYEPVSYRRGSDDPTSHGGILAVYGGEGSNWIIHAITTNCRDTVHPPQRRPIPRRMINTAMRIPIITKIIFSI